MDEMKQGTAHPTERATKDEASERRRQYREEREQELKDTLPRPSALSRNDTGA